MHDPLQPHTHEPNPTPPSADPTFNLLLPNGRIQSISVNVLTTLPSTTVTNCYIISTGHGTSGPFPFTGVTLLDFIQAYNQEAWSHIEVVSADGFGNRVEKEELLHPDPAGAILLAWQIDGQPLTRAQGLVRLIVPGERDDALRQVKWVGKVCLQP